MRPNHDPTMRRALAARLRHFTTAATAPGSDDRTRKAAAKEAARLADKTIALLLRESGPDEELTAALAEYFDARSEDFQGWRP